MRRITSKYKVNRQYKNRIKLHIQYSLHDTANYLRAVWLKSDIESMFVTAVP